MKTLVFGDLHLPHSHPGYLSFCRDIHAKYRCDSVVSIGDVIDHHRISFHPPESSSQGASDERMATLEKLGPWVSAFPDTVVVKGNHDIRAHRLAASVGITDEYIKGYSELWKTPGWDWVDSTVVDGVYIDHGEGCGGRHPAYQKAQAMMCSVAIGHVHSAAGIVWLAGPTRRIFGMSVGCGVDEESIAFAYGKHSLRKGIIACGVLIDGVPYHEICPIGPGEKYHRSRFNECKPKSTFVVSNGQSNSKRSRGATARRTKKAGRSNSKRT